MDLILAKLSEKSTILGLCALLSAFGVSFFAAPENQAAVTQAVLGIVGVVAVVLKERK